MGRTVAAGLCYTSRPQDDSGAFSDSGEREGGRASYRCSFGWGLLFFLSI